MKKAAAPKNHITKALLPLAVEISSLNLDAENVRTHGEKNLDAIKSSLQFFSQLKPVVVQQQGRVVRAGNGTVMAAKALGWTRIAAVVAPMTAKMAKAFSLADNRTNDLSDFDRDKLSAVAKELKGGEFDLSSLGWDDKELEKLYRVPGEVTEVDAPQKLTRPVSRAGDIWVLGNHRLMCGSCTDPAAMDRLMKGRRARIVWTDPPYGIEKLGGDAMQREGPRRAAGAKEIRNDDFDLEKLDQLLRDSFKLGLKHTEAGAPWYVAAPGSIGLFVFGKALHDLAIGRHSLVWVKDRFVPGRADFHYRHETIFYGWTPGGRHMAPTERDIDTVWEFPRPTRSEDHPTMKPVPLVAKALQVSSGPGDLVLDMFGGSGTTLIAAEETGRECCTMELDPIYTDVIVRRWQKVTGKDGVLEKGGNTWLKQAKARGVKIVKDPEPTEEAA